MMTTQSINVLSEVVAPQVNETLGSQSAVAEMTNEVVAPHYCSDVEPNNEDSDIEQETRLYRVERSVLRRMQKQSNEKLYNILIKKTRTWTLEQLRDELEYSEEFIREDYFGERFKKQVRRLVKNFANQYQEQSDFGQLISILPRDKCEFIENMIIFLHMLYKSSNNVDRLLSIVNFIKLNTKKSLCSDILLRINSFLSSMDYTVNVWQSDTYSNISSIESWLDKYDELEASPMFKAVKKIFLFTIVSTFLGETQFIKNLGYDHIEQEVIRRKMFKGPSAIHAILKVLLFITKRGYQMWVTQSFQPLFHSGEKYEEWYNDVFTLKRLEPFLSNIEPHGMSKQQYEKLLLDTIEKGVAIEKHITNIDPSGKKVIARLLSELRVIRATILSKSEARRSRRSPFTLQIYGGSKVAKSQFTNMMFQYYGKLFSLPTEEQYMYVKNAIANFWDGLQTYCWCIVYDDVAAKHPNKCMNGDPSVDEILQIVNNVSHVPDQASLEDKGTIPLRPRLFMVTTNIKDLHARTYYSNDYAVLRRLPYVVELIPKKKYQDNKNGGAIDPNKLPALEEGQLPDFWIIKIWKNQLVSNNGSQSINQVLLHTFYDISSYLEWVSYEMCKHEDIQNKSDNCQTVVNNMILCETSHIPEKYCRCPTHYNEYVRNVERPRKNSEAEPLLIYQSHESDNNCESFIENICSNAIYYILEKFIWYSPSIILRSSLAASLAVVRSRRNMKSYLHDLGRRSYASLKPHAKILALGTLILSLYGLVSLYISFRTKKDKDIFHDGYQLGYNTCHSDWQLDEVNQTGQEPKPFNEPSDTTNKFKVEYEVTPYDLSRPTLSTKGTERDEFVRRIEGNLIHLIYNRVDEKGDNYTCRNCAVCLKGNVYVTNKHFFDKIQNGTRLQVISNKLNTPIGANIEFELLNHEVYPIGGDLVAFKILNLPPNKDITKYLAKPSYRGYFPGFLINRDQYGCINVNNFKKFNYAIIKKDNITFDGLQMVNDKPTEYGDCGALAVLETNSGFIIIGVHTMARLVDGKYAFSISQHINDSILNNIPGIIPILGDIKPNSDKYELQSYIHPKSPLIGFKGNAIIYGSYKGYASSSHSRVTHTKLVYGLSNFGMKIKYTKPDMGDKPWKYTLNLRLNPVGNLDEKVAKNVVNNMVSHFMKNLSKNDLAMLHELTDRCTVNGAPGIKYVDSINKNSSMGFPYHKSKRYYLIPKPTPENPDDMDFPQEIWDKVQEIEDCYEKNVMYNPIFTTHLKDEPVTFEKAKEGKTRIFSSCPIEFVLMYRRWMLSFIRMVCKNRKIFRCMVGVTAQNLEWEQLEEMLTHRFGKDRCFAGDFKAYDLTVHARVMIHVHEVWAQIAERAGQKKMAHVIRMIGYDTSYPLMIYKMELVRFFSSLVSGIPGTAYINSQCNLFIMMYVYSYLCYEHGYHTDLNCDDFFENVDTINYGDDNATAVSESVPFYNHTNVAQALKEYLNMTYTMAEKGAESVPYIPFSEVTFLKRHFVYNEDIGAVVAPLDWNSIEKMLMVTIPSKTISEDMHLEAICSSAVSEAFFHGKAKFKIS